jgi:murein tripeptide amidase MpaA
MMRRVGFVLGLLLLLVAAFGQQLTYGGQKVIHAYLTTPAQLQLVQSLKIDIWSDYPRVAELDMRVTPAQLARLQAEGIPYTVMIDDVQKLLDAQAREVHAQGLFDNYYNLDTWNAQLLTWQTQYPTLCKRVTIGTSLEGRTIYALKITSGSQLSNNSGSRKVGVLFHGAEHAREWIGVSVTMYIANFLLTNYGIDTRATDIVNHMEVYCAPVMNVDGYNYTWTNDRMWRKNRRHNSDGTYGVDNNRNWGFHWAGPGSSGTPGDEDYRGTAAFSEPETQAFRDFVLNNPRIKGYMDYHSYAELIMYPWGYTSGAPADGTIMNEEVQKMAKLINSVHGITYGAGQIYTTIYPASGTSCDWNYGVAHIWGFTIELRDTGQYGFLLPVSQIVPTCEENLAAALDFTQWVYSRSKETTRKR